MDWGKEREREVERKRASCFTDVMKVIHPWWRVVGLENEKSPSSLFVSHLAVPLSFLPFSLSFLRSFLIFYEPVLFGNLAQHLCLNLSTHFGTTLFFHTNCTQIAAKMSNEAPAWVHPWHKMADVDWLWPPLVLLNPSVHLNLGQKFILARKSFTQLQALVVICLCLVT